MNVKRIFSVIFLSIALLLPIQPVEAAALEPEAAFVPADGAWTAETATGKAVSFNVSASGIQWDTFSIAATHFTGLCTADFTYIIPGPGSITNNKFSYTNAAGSFSFTGEFTSPTEASGTYAFSSFSTGCGSYTSSGKWFSPVGTLWSGTTNLGKEVSFKVMTNGAQWYKFVQATTAAVGSCSSVTLTQNVYGPDVITGHQFSYTNTSGTYSFTGQFTSPTTATGAYTYTNYSVYGCGSLTQSGTWTASGTATPLTAAFYSSGQQDGWILESAEASNVGGTLNSALTNFSVGDDALNRQYRGILHFDTSSLPDKASITSATLMIKKQKMVGVNPFTNHQNILVDVKKGSFSNSSALQAADFQAKPSRATVGTFKNTPLAGNWYSANLIAASLQFINGAGETQFRLRFKLDDDNDLKTDCFRFFSGNYNPNPTYRPTLTLTYYIFP